VRPIRKLAIGLWLAVFLVAGLRFGAGWWERQAAQETTDEITVDSGVNSTDDKQAVDSEASVAPEIGIGDLLPELTLNDLRGQPQALSQWSGRTLLINFWATWCGPCRQEMPLLEQFQQSQDPGRLQIVGIAIDRLEPVLRFIGETGVTYPQLIGELDATQAAERFAPGFALPLTVVVTRDDRVHEVKMGELRPADLERYANLE
jgi:thiol-disulfide isomerase/thioredoxin